MYLEVQYESEEIELFEEILNQSFNEMQNFEYVDESEESDSDFYTDNEETEEYDSDEDCQCPFDHSVTNLENNNNEECIDMEFYKERLQEESEADENIMKNYMREVLRMFNFDTLLWIKEALDSRKIANVFEIWTKDVVYPAAIEKDRQFYVNSIKNIKYGILSTLVFRYRSKIEGLNHVDDLKFVLSKYLEFQERREESLANLYKLVKNLQTEFIKSSEINV